MFLPVHRVWLAFAMTATKTLQLNPSSRSLGLLDVLDKEQVSMGASQQPVGQTLSNTSRVEGVIFYSFVRSGTKTKASSLH